MKKYVALLVILGFSLLLCPLASIAVPDEGRTMRVRFMGREEVVEEIHALYKHARSIFGKVAGLYAAYPFEGIGVMLSAERELVSASESSSVSVYVWNLSIQVKNIFRGSPAEGKLKTGDVIFAVNGEEIGHFGLGLNEESIAKNMHEFLEETKQMIANGGDVIDLTIVRNDEETLTFQLKKAEIGADFVPAVTKAHDEVAELVAEFLNLQKQNVEEMEMGTLITHYSTITELVNKADELDDALWQAYKSLFVEEL